MCGIVGYLGKENAFPILINGLKMLEYRGYDSAGVALLNTEGNNEQIRIIKQKGRVSDLETLAKDKDVSGGCGIAHTRWATHGEPCRENAHPHTGSNGDIAIVHNGIIENYHDIKDQLIAKGCCFASSTDTEVLAQLIGLTYRDNGRNLSDAVRKALHLVIGAYAIAVVEKDDPTHIVVARKSSPLAIGLVEGNKEFYLASDASPIVGYTNHIIYLKDEQICDLRLGEEIKITDLENVAQALDITDVDLDISKLSKGGYDHFMEREIFDQPEVLKDCMRGRLVDLGTDNPRVVLSALETHKDRLVAAQNITIVACGTSWHAAHIGKLLIEQICRKKVEVAYASEFRYSNPVISENDVVIALSQSGETADTLAAIELAKSRGALIFGIVNAVGSSIARHSDTGVYIHVGPEIGVASTKAFTGQVTVLTMLALGLGKELGTIDHEEYCRTIEELALIPRKIEKILKEQNEKIKTTSRQFTYARNFLYLGRGFNYPVALEGALKLKEISYIHAEGYPAAEMKHGPIALVDSDMPIVFVATHHQQYQKIITNMQEVKSRGGRIFAVVTEGDTQVKALAEEVFEVPATIGCLAPLLSVVPLQLLAYHVAVFKGLNVDMPRNLAKSVTVE